MGIVALASGAEQPSRTGSGVGELAVKAAARAAAPFRRGRHPTSLNNLGSTAGMIEGPLIPASRKYGEG